MSRGSRRWQREHGSDPFVRRARSEGYRSRAAYKLVALDDRYRLLRRGAVVVDLGAAPGGWSQVAVQRVGNQGRVVAVDLLPMEPLAGVRILRADLHDAETVTALADCVGDAGAGVVLSDMAPNLTGIRDADHARSVELVEIAAAVAQAVLRPGGALVAKVFEGPSTRELRRRLGTLFARVELSKPQASRSRSAEVYLVARDFRGEPAGLGV